MQESVSLSSWQYGAAGALSGVFTRFTCQPFDVVKIRFQIQMLEKADSKLKYKSLIQAVAKIGKEEGIRSFWKGHIPAQWLSAIYGAVQFATYEKFTSPWRKQSVAHFGGGALSGAMAVVASYPFDVLRTRMVAQGEPKIYKNMLDAGRQIAAREGTTGFFKGITAACVHTAPFSALVFGINHILTSFLTKFAQSDDPQLSTSSLLSCGAVAGFSSKIIVYPFDLIKKRLQIQGMPNGESASGPIVRSSGLMSCFYNTLRNEGMLGLYRGITPSLLKATVSNAIYLTGYDLCCQLIRYL